MLQLFLSDLPGEILLELKQAPRSMGGNILSAQLDQHQVGYHRYANGAFHPFDLFGDLMLAHTQAAFEFPDQ